MESIVVAAISAAGAIAVALINVRAVRRDDPKPDPPQPANEPGGRASRRGRLEPLRRSWAWLWAQLGRLPQLERPRTAWVAALVGFLFGGFGIALYFRKQVDVLVGLIFVLPLVVATRGSEGAETNVSWWYWPFATLAATYCVLRVESSNRRLLDPESASPAASG